MTAEPPQSPITEAVRSLEVRGIFPGQLETAVAGWFGRFPAAVESREDTYLLDPQLRGLSGKGPRGHCTGGEGVPRQPGRRTELVSPAASPERPSCSDLAGPDGFN